MDTGAREIRIASLSFQFPREIMQELDSSQNDTEFHSMIEKSPNCAGAHSTGTDYYTVIVEVRTQPVTNQLVRGRTLARLERRRNKPKSDHGMMATAFARLKAVQGLC
jgi:hypothetical protein